MAQAFVNTYKDHFRWNDPKKLAPILPKQINEILPDNDPEFYILPTKISKDEADQSGMNLSQAQALVKQMQLRKMRTTYQMHYCRRDKRGQHKGSQEGEELSFGSELLEYCKKLYERRDRKLLPPIPTLRRVNGYIRYAKLFTPLTVYQDDFGKVAYNILKK